MRDRLNNLKVIYVLLISLSICLSQEVITDTIYSNDSLDGEICYMYEQASYYIVHGTTDGGPGDFYNPFIGVWVYCRNYYTFDLSSITIDTSGFELISATFQLYQYFSVGNDEIGEYPVWDFSGGDTNYCYLDHVNYGNILDLSDWTAGDEGGSQTLYPLYAVVSSTPDTGFRTIDVKSLIKSDLSGGRSYSQYRIHFPIDTDYDYYSDNLAFRDESNYITRPILIVKYQTVTTVVQDENRKLPDDFLLSQNYPNPFNSITTIEYKINKADVYELAIIDIKGRETVVFGPLFHTVGKFEVQWDGKNNTGVNMPSGVYFYRLGSKHQSIYKKLVHLR